MFALVFMSSLSESQQKKKKKDVKLFVRAKSERWYIYVVDDCAWEAMPSGGGGDGNEETQIYHKVYTHTHSSASVEYLNRIKGRGKTPPKQALSFLRAKENNKAFSAHKNSSSSLFLFRMRIFGASQRRSRRRKTHQHRSHSTAAAQ